jgi:pyrroloquinoline quinone biosynthesis protein B
MMRRPLLGFSVFLLAAAGSPAPEVEAPYLLVLGIAQDAGVPQAGRRDDPGWEDPSRRRLATCLALVDGERRYLFDATPDFKYQLAALDRGAPVKAYPGIDGIFLTHAHIGHYTGLMMLGHEAMGARRVPVFAMPKMADFLRGNGPWSQLVRYENIALEPLAAGRAVKLREGLSVTPFTVPHRQEFSEVVGFRIDGPSKSALYLPDIDRWEEWDQDLAEVLRTVDAAYVDGTFFANGEIPGRDMSSFPHPFITTTMERLAEEPAEIRRKVRFIHLNHTNPALLPDSPARREVIRRGFALAEEGETFPLGESP